MKSDGLTGVRIILIYRGKCLFHLRDDRPGISHPNKWSFVSGSIEEGESPEEAMGRECQEEIGIMPDGLQYLGRSEVSACFYAFLSESEVARLKLGEGQEIRFFKPEEMVGLSMTPKLEELVTIHKENLSRLIGGESVAAEDFELTL